VDDHCTTTTDVDSRWGVAMVLTNVAAIANQEGRPREALDLGGEAAKIFAGLADEAGQQ
jgi:hypothetical protein